MNKQKSQKKKINTLKHKNLVGGYGIKTKSNNIRKYNECYECYENINKKLFNYY